MHKPHFQPSALPSFKAIDPTQIEPTIRALLDKNRDKLNELLSQETPFTWDNLMQPLEHMGDEFGKVWSPISHLHSVLETEALREAYNQALPLITEYHTEFLQNEALFKAMVGLAESKAFHTLDAAQRKIIENDIRDFKLAGIHLPLHQKRELAALQKKLSLLTTRFSENVLDATQHWTLHLTDANDLQGLPSQAMQLAIDNANRRRLKGFVLTLDLPSYSSAMKFLDNRAIRQKLYEAHTTRASDQGPDASKWDNAPIMADILKTRHDIAKLVGFDNFAAYSLATKMAKTPDDVLHFLNNLVEKSKPFAQTEYEEINALAQSLHAPTPLEAWDIAYYSEKLQSSQFSFSEEDVRPYFPVQKVLAGLFALVQQLYGLTIAADSSVQVWHPDVCFFNIHDEHGNLRGGFYIDLYTRPHKRDGAWMDDCRTRFRLNKNEIQSPVAYLTCNFMPKVSTEPALLTHEDVMTLFHEFGHCLHHLLTTVDYPSVAGINGVAWDAVEFPSQFMENFCWEKESLALISGHYQTNAPLPDDLFQKMIAAKHFQTGLQMLRQLEFALFDFRLHLEYNDAAPKPIQTILDDVRKAVAIIPIPAFNRFQNTFSHIFAGGYAAGYYSYKWAEVLSSDAYAKFEEQGIFNPETGKSFMHNILEVGGVREPMASFVAFRGREPHIDALLRHSGIT